MRRFTVILLVVVVVLGGVMAPASAQSNTIVGIAQSDSNFSILVEAVVAADLAGTLSGGEWTVFAPTNAAFANLLDRLNLTKEELLANEALLTNVLLYHVVPGTVRAADIPTLFDSSGLAFPEMANGDRTSLAVDGSSVFVNGNPVIAADILASNGVIHVIDTVLLPPSNVVVTAGANNTGQFDTLLAAVQAAGLVDTLAGGGPFTILAPTDAAFGDLLNALGVSAGELLANTELLTSVLTYHVIPGEFYSGDITAAVGGSGSFAAPTVNGDTVNIQVNGGFIRVDDANVIGTNIVASNGVIHVIDKVILPG